MERYAIHRLDSVAFHLFGLDFHWYWLFYLLGSLWIFYMGQALIGRGYGNISRGHFVKMCWPAWLALFLGSRVFYILIYHPRYFMENPEMIPKIWAGGMSFHGALVGIVAIVVFQARLLKISPLHFTDMVATLAPLGLMLGRIGNFINGELVGKITRVPWAVIFPKALDEAPRHPSQLYGALVEGLLLFILLYGQKKYLYLKGHQSILFLFAYGVGRLIVGFFRAPDPQWGPVLGPLSLGQLFCTAMIAWALLMEWHFRPFRIRFGVNGGKI
ncbi:MAG: prolipoprotein diacylglyceryl transferase [Bacteriovoracales bacterium]|nr:prolipoprotein diacylglyceryl transferase [Bacteriovoracales bacterium]